MTLLLNPYFWAASVLSLALAFFGGCSAGASKWEGKYDAEVAAHKATKQGHAAVLTDLAAKTKATAEAVKAAGKQYRTDRAANDLNHKQELANAKSNHAAVVRDLRNGDLQLHDHWTGYQPIVPQGGAFAPAGGQDGYAELRYASAAEDVQAGDEADAWIGWLQRELINTRKACAAEAIYP